MGYWLLWAILSLFNITLFVGSARFLVRTKRLLDDMAGDLSDAGGRVEP